VPPHRIDEGFARLAAAIRSRNASEAGRKLLIGTPGVNTSMETQQLAGSLAAAEDHAPGSSTFDRPCGCGTADGRTARLQFDAAEEAGSRDTDSSRGAASPASDEPWTGLDAPTASLLALAPGGKALAMVVSAPSLQRLAMCQSMTSMGEGAP
jgi:hypothetical protein